MYVKRSWRSLLPEGHTIVVTGVGDALGAILSMRDLRRLLARDRIDTLEKRYAINE